MKNRLSLITTYQYSIIFFIILLICFTGYVGIKNEFNNHASESLKIRQDYINNRKFLIRNEVSKVIAYIQHKKSQAEDRLKQDVKSRTYEAYQIAEHIYDNNKNTKSLQEIKQMIQDALHAAAWDQSRGYYFVEDMDGYEIVNRNNPELVGKNILSLRDGHGTFIMKEIISTVTSGGEGFCTYHWNMPNDPDTLVPKISYVKLFKPLNWIIGNGKYLNTEESLIQKEILSYVEKITYEKTGYIFIGDWNGNTLSGPSKGKNMFHMKDENGIWIVQDLIQAAKAGGGYVTYVMPQLEGHDPLPKISYAEGIEEWEWYVGTGIYIHEIDAALKMKEKELKEKTWQKTIKTSMYLIFLLIFIFILAHYISLRIKRNLKLFKTFFNQAVISDTAIDTNNLHFNEFQQLAESANQMVDQRKKVRQELQASESRFYKIIETAHIPMAINNEMGDIILINQNFSELFGYNKNDIPTMDHWWELAYPDKSQRIKAILKWKERVKDSKSRKNSLFGEMRTIRCKDDSIRQIEVNYTQVDSIRLTTFHDLTDKIKADKEKELLRKQLMQAQKMEAIGLMAGGVAHDLNNILSGIIGYPEIILRQLPTNSKLRKSIKAIQDCGTRASDVVADLITVARGVASARDVSNLNHLIQEYLSSPEYLKLMEKYDLITCKTDLEKNLLNVSCSETHIKKCIMNLVMNAAESITGPGHIMISTANKYLDKKIFHNQNLNIGEYSVISISDTGEGIENEDLERIFEPFYTKKVMGLSGTGLGLTVVWNTVKDHNGGVSVQSSDSGTVFDLYFPATRKNVTPVTSDKDIDKLMGKGEKILIIDDEKLQQELASELLTLLGYTVHSVSSGEEALIYLQNAEVDLLLLDMIMAPGINGRKTYEKLIRTHPGQKAIITSGYSENDEVKKTQQLGAGEFVKKPYQMHQLGQAVKKELCRGITT